MLDANYLYGDERMMRRPYIIACALSLLLFALTVGAWLWSCRLTEPSLWEKPNRFAILQVWVAPSGIYWTRKAAIGRAYYSWSYWKIALLTLVVPLWPLVRRFADWEAKARREAKRRRDLAAARTRGLCHTCGYDLRASKDRCPECGTPVPQNVGMRRFTACVCLVAIWGGGCKRYPASADYSVQIKSLESADPAKDVAAAIAAGDTRFAGVMGDGPVVPAAPDWARLGSRVRFIPNTSDVIESAQHGKLQQVAYDYAKRYNELLLTKVPSLAASRPADGAQPASP